MNPPTNQQNTAGQPPPTFARFSPLMLLATGFGFGYSPIMPGTVGALWGLPLAWALAEIPPAGPVGAVWLRLTAIGVLCLIGVPLCGIAAIRMGKKDPGSVVFDEIATMPIVFLFLSAADLAAHPWLLAVGFALHRVFDITKPPPCRQLEALPGGWGIMVDDVAAAVYALVCLEGLLYVLHIPHGLG